MKTHRSIFIVGLVSFCTVLASNAIADTTVQKGHNYTHQVNSRFGNSGSHSAGSKVAFATSSKHHGRNGQRLNPINHQEDVNDSLHNH